MTFETFNPSWPGIREAFEVAKEYVAEQDPPWLLLSGNCGCGKTHLAAAIANARFQQGEVVLFSVVPQLLDHLRATFAPASETDYDVLFEKVREAGLLILDDLGAEHTTPWAKEKLFQIINHRYIHTLPTVVTTNEQMNGLDDRIRSRLSDIHVVRHVVIHADDYRPRNVPRRRNWDQPLW
jgi:DNA replication protein DnaC